LAPPAGLFGTPTTYSAGLHCAIPTPRSGSVVRARGGLRAWLRSAVIFCGAGPLRARAPVVSRNIYPAHFVRHAPAVATPADRQLSGPPMLAHHLQQIAGGNRSKRRASDLVNNSARRPSLALALYVASRWQAFDHGWAPVTARTNPAMSLVAVVQRALHHPSAPASRPPFCRVEGMRSLAPPRTTRRNIKASRAQSRCGPQPVPR